MQQVKKKFVHSCVCESCLYICVHTGVPLVVHGVFVSACVKSCLGECAFMCTLSASEEGGGINQ